MIKLNEAYQGYTLDAGLERAAKMFRVKYGYAPTTAAQAGTVILCGPIEPPAPKSLAARAEAGSVAMGQSDALQLAMELGGATA